ncbi:putative ribonuclease H-like domain-containing protein, partial [Tanacetum coccineum]
MLGSQITDKCKKGLGYSAVPSPNPLIYNRPNKLDLSYSGLNEFEEPDFKGYGPKDSKQKSNEVCNKKSNNTKETYVESLVEEQVSQDTGSFVESSPKIDKETVFPVNKKVEFTKPKYHEKPFKRSIRVDAKTTHPSVHRNMSPEAVLLKTGLTPLNTVRLVNAAHPKIAVHTLTRRYVHTAKGHYYNGRPRAVTTARLYSGQVNVVRVKGVNAVKSSSYWVWVPTKPNGASLAFKRHNYIDARGMPQQEDKGFVDSGCLRHMTGNIAYLSDFKEFDGGYVAFGGGAYGGRITGKGTLKTDNLDFEDVYFVNELKFNLFSVSQMCDKKNYVLFTDTECLVLSPNFKLPDENQILLKIPRKDNMYSFDMKNIVPKESLTCLIAKATLDESMLWHRRLGHINFKNINKLVKDNLVRGLPTKRFENDQTCVACLKGKQHRASCKSKVLNPITKPLFMLHMDLFGPTFVSSLMHKKYCLVVTDDYSRFTWVLFLTTKDETSEILKNFIKEIENLVDKKVKIIKSDNGTEFKNKVMDDFCKEKALSFMRPFGCHVTILNTLDSLAKFNGKSDEENKPMIEGNGPKWLFDIDSLTQSMNYVSVTAGTISNKSAGTQSELNAGTSEAINQDCIVMPIWKDASYFYSCIMMPIWKDTSYFDSPTKDVENGEPKTVNDAQKQVEDASPDVNAGSLKLNVVDPSINTASSNEQHSTEDEPEVDLGNITNSYIVLTTPNTRIHKDHLIDNVIGEVKSTVQTRRMTKPTSEQGFLSDVFNQQALLQLYLIHPRWKQCGKNFCNSNINRQEECIEYEEVFAPVARIKAIRLFLAYASFMGFLVYQMDVKSAFLYGTIEEEVYVTQPPGFKDPDHPGKVYKVVKALYDLHQAPRACQDKYIAEILKKFNYSDVKSASTPVDLKKPLVKDGDADDVDVHLYRSMIGSWMYLTASRPDIMFAVCACARFQVTPKTSHLLAVKRIFRYLKGKPTLGL